MNAPTAAKAPPSPTALTLREAALSYLARHASSEAGLVRVLRRRLNTWAQRARRAGTTAEEIAEALERAEALVPEVVASLVRAKLVDDASFAEARARRLSEQGKSRRAVAAHLAAKGVDATLVREVVPEDRDRDFLAALTYARKRRLGPFAREPQETGRRYDPKALGALARQGFDRSTCERVLTLSPEEAESLAPRARW